MEQIRSQTYPEVTYLAGRCWRSEAWELHEAVRARSVKEEKQLILYKSS